jgi:hypothetical protein
MKMAIRLNEFAEGLDDEMTILDLKPRLKTKVIEYSSIEPQNESWNENCLAEIDARPRQRFYRVVELLGRRGSLWGYFGVGVHFHAAYPEECGCYRRRAQNCFSRRRRRSNQCSGKGNKGTG